MPDPNFASTYATADDDFRESLVSLTAATNDVQDKTTTVANIEQELAAAKLDLTNAKSEHKRIADDSRKKADMMKKAIDDEFDDANKPILKPLPTPVAPQLANVG